MSTSLELENKRTLRKRSAIKRSVGEILFDSANILFLAVFAFLTLYPFWYIFILSLNEGKDSAMGGIWFWPRKWTLANYQYVLLNKQVLIAYRTTILRTVIGAVLSVLVTGTAAYSLSKHYLPGRNAFITLCLIPMFIGGTLVANFVLIAKLGMLNTFWVYIIPGAFSFFNMIIMRTYFYTIPPSLEESAKIDGATTYRIFFQLVMPLSMPIIATIFLFNAVGYWLDFSTNMLYTAGNKALMTLQYLLYLLILSKEASMNTLTENRPMTGAAWSNKSQEVTSQAVKMAVIMVATLPILFVYPFLQKYFVKGVLIGSVKE
jgi:putative aldouronate transport system permease protein